MCSRKRSVDFTKMFVVRNAKYWLYSGNVKDENSTPPPKHKLFYGSLLLLIRIKSKPKSVGIITSLLTPPYSKLKLYFSHSEILGSFQKALLSPGSKTFAKAAASASSAFSPCHSCSAWLTPQSSAKTPHFLRNSLQSPKAKFPFQVLPYHPGTNLKRILLTFIRNCPFIPCLANQTGNP